MGVDQQLIKGSISIMILKLLDYSDMYGYQIIKELDRRSDSTFTLKEGTLYPVLHSLENQGCIESYWEDTALVRKRRYYHITTKGKNLLESKKREWAAFSSAVDMVLGIDENIRACLVSLSRRYFGSIRALLRQNTREGTEHSLRFFLA